MRKILCIIVIQLLFFSCQKDILEGMTSLDSTGEQFMELISSYGNWRTDFDKMKEIGIPQLNEASLIYNLLQGGYCIVLYL